VDNHWLLTPYALDAPLPALARLARPGWNVSSGVPSTANTDDASDSDRASGAGGADADGQLTRMAAIHGPLAADVAKIATEGGRPVCIVGDCCQPIAVLAGLQRAGLEPMVVWFDAHGDFNTHETTLSGYVAGMTIAMITGRGNQALVEAAGLKPLPDTDIILADARDLDPAERALLEKSKVAHLTDFNELVERVGASDRPFYVHFDTDVIDCAEAPATQFPVAGGPGVETLRNVAASLHRTGRLAGASMNPWAFDKDTDGRTAAACWSIFNALVGGA
jgi:arginase